jgi:isoleucyl-tRNA synthetase
VREATKGYDAYKIDEAVRPIDQFIDDLSVWYVRRARSRLKGEDGEEVKVRTYNTLAYVLHTFARAIAPVMPFIAERIYTTVGGERESVHLESWPEGGSVDTLLLDEMKKVREVVTAALALRTQAKIAVRQPLGKLTLKETVSTTYHSVLSEELNVKEIAIDASLTELYVLDTTITKELQAEGDVRNLMRAIQDARKERGLTPKDSITLVTTFSVPEQFVSDLRSTCKIHLIEQGEGPYTAETSQGVISFDIR